MEELDRERGAVLYHSFLYFTAIAPAESEAVRQDIVRRLRRLREREHEAASVALIDAAIAVIEQRQEVAA